MTWIEELYDDVLSAARATGRCAIPYIRRMVRLIALPYCFFVLVDWTQCKRPRSLVALDLLYIFFRLKYFPDNYSLCRLWEKDRTTWMYYYGSIYDPYQRARLREAVQPAEYEILFDDKYVCHQLCAQASIPMPNLIGYVSSQRATVTCLTEYFRNGGEKKLIMKPAREKAGRGILLAIPNSGAAGFMVCDVRGRERALSDSGPYVIEEYLEQHIELSRIAESTNTVRIATFLTKQSDVIVVGALMRFGVEGSFVDNTSRGGIAAGVDLDTGQLLSPGYDFASRLHTCHPDSGVALSEIFVPRWNEVMELAERVQRAFPYFRLLGQDIAIGQKGPVCIELNPAYDNVGLEAGAGPILKNALLWKAFREEGLLVNSPSRDLY